MYREIPKTNLYHKRQHLGVSKNGRFVNSSVIMMLLIA